MAHSFEIKDFFKIDYGAPCPIIICDDNRLNLCFYEDIAGDYDVDETATSHTLIALGFHDYLYYSFGTPGNELLDEHPYSAVGIISGGFYELFDTDLLKQLQLISAKHPYYDEERWKNYRHYVITFHDRLFECVAVNFSWERRKGLMQEQAIKMAEKIFEGNE